MPTFKVPAFDPKTGKPVTLQVPATSEAQAIEHAKKQGWTVHATDAATTAALQESGVSREVAELASIHDQLTGLTNEIRTIRQSRLIRAPIGTIAVAVIIATILVSFLSWFAYLGLVGYANERAAEQRFNSHP